MNPINSGGCRGYKNPASGRSDILWLWWCPTYKLVYNPNLLEEKVMVMEVVFVIQ